MLKKSISLLILVMIAISSNQASKGENTILLEINGEKITKSEFLKTYKKNNQQHNVVDPKSVEEYLDLYINFRLKVKEALAQGLDTVDSFIEELEEYRTQLAKPYLTDDEVAKQLVKEVYDRLQYDIRASHIIINLPENASPEDTLEAYNKIVELRDRIIEGEKFEELAVEYSDDPAVRDREATGNRPAMPGNKGDLGFFTAFQMIYPFETAAYNTTPGEISMPLRTQYGYHIIKVKNRMPSPGQVRIAHIMVLSSDDNQENGQAAHDKINEVYQKLEDGEPFEQLAKEYSDDQSSSNQGGELNLNQVKRALPEFVEKVPNLEPTGEYSEPFKTSYGWHILKVLNIKPMQSFDEMADDLRQRVMRNSRSELIEKSFINDLKDEYHFEENITALEIFNEIIDNSVFEATWTIPEDHELEKELCRFANESLTQKDFAKYIEKNQKRTRSQQNIPVYVKEKYGQFVSEKLKDYENSRLEEKYPEFREVMQEYHDGILLFELTDQMVWTKAMKDTTGLKEYYQANKDNYIVGTDAAEDEDPQPKPLDEIRGMVIADYQNYLEKEWMKELKEKYNIIVHDDVLSEIINE